MILLKARLRYSQLRPAPKSELPRESQQALLWRCFSFLVNFSLYYTNKIIMYEILKESVKKLSIRQRYFFIYYSYIIFKISFLKHFWIDTYNKKCGNNYFISDITSVKQKYKAWSKMRAHAHHHKSVTYPRRAKQGHERACDSVVTC